MRLTQDSDDRLVRNNGGISEPEFRLAPTIAYVFHQSQHPLRAYNHEGMHARCAAVRKSPKCDAQAAEKPTCSGLDAAAAAAATSVGCHESLVKRTDTCD